MLQYNLLFTITVARKHVLARTRAHTHSLRLLRRMWVGMGVKKHVRPVYSFLNPVPRLKTFPIFLAVLWTPSSRGKNKQTTSWQTNGCNDKLFVHREVGKWIMHCCVCGCTEIPEKNGFGESSSILSIISSFSPSVYLSRVSFSILYLSSQLKCR